MSSRLQLHVRNLSVGRRHLVNAHEVKAGTGPIHQFLVARICKGKYIRKIREELSCIHLWWIFWIENFRYWIKIAEIGLARGYPATNTRIFTTLE